MPLRLPFKRSNRPATPPAKRHFRLYWVTLFAALVTPVIFGVPYLGDAVARASLLAAVLVAWQAARIYSPLKQGSLAAMQIGLISIISAVALVFTVAAVYVARTGQAVPADDHWLPAILGAVYIAIAHVLLARFARARVPLTPTPGLKA